MQNGENPRSITKSSKFNHAAFFSRNLRRGFELAIITQKWVMVFMFKKGLEILMSGREVGVPFHSQGRHRKTFMNC